MIWDVNVKAKDQPHLSLGQYDAMHVPKGFAIHITPYPEPDTIVTQVNLLERPDEYELVLSIANYGDKTITAQVWAL